MVNTDKRSAAENDYMLGMKYREIAEKYGVSIDTVKSWKKRHEWDRKGVHPKKEKGAPKNKGCNEESNAEASKEVQTVMQNEELSDKQKLFCVYYVRSFNATKAYQKAYGVSHETAAAIGYRQLAKDGVRKEIERLKQAKLNREFLKEEDIFQKFMDIAFADITDYVEFGRETVPVMGAFGPVVIKDEDTGEKTEITQDVNVIRFKESADVDGTLIAEVKQGKNGASIKLADKMKALEWLADHMNLATEEQKAKIAKLRKEAKKEDTDTSIVISIEGELNDYAD